MTKGGQPLRLKHSSLSSKSPKTASRFGGNSNQSDFTSQFSLDFTVMGGDSYSSSLVLAEDVPSSGQDFPDVPIDYRVIGDEEGSVEIKDLGVPDSDEIPDVAERQRLKVFSEVLTSYEDLKHRFHLLEEAKNKILSYTPGSWADLSKHYRPNATSLLLLGPKGAGKSSLINKISRLLEDNIFLPGRAQVSCKSSTEDGTYFVHEYMIPRGSGSFCLYDTRGLSVDLSENQKMIERWITKGVRHGELIRRKSDSLTLTAELKCKARGSFFSSPVRPVNFVVFVVNGISVLESLNNADGKKNGYNEMIAANFNNPFLSFKDDKPAIVVTHGDLLPISDRARVRAYLGELLGVPPTGQIFDIPENDDPATRLAVFDLLIYCLERADRNLPTKDMFMDKVSTVWIIAAMVFFFGVPGLHHDRRRARPTPPWHKILRLW